MSTLNIQEIAKRKADKLYAEQQYTKKMNAEEYKQLMEQRRVLDYTILNITIKELYANEEMQLVDEIKRILTENKIEKPALHEKANDIFTNYYKVDLCAEDIDKISGMFLKLEVGFISESGDTTSTAAFYASLADRWFNVGKNNSE